MINKDYINNNWSTYIDGDNLIVSVRSETDRTVIPIADFVSTFGDCEPNYTSLIARDNGNKGFKDFFNTLKSEGILL